ncbi:helix-turn-helix domain-containing protein [Fulvivirga sp.]|uniref:AraC family transcriptional regulator n=1 Tax=Fulvivirga sp. TaxID=1931237 RepID=UPI0032EC313A
MQYQTFKPHKDLETIVKCYWTLEVPAQQKTERQLILPDGCVDLCFNFGDNMKRYTSDTDFVIQPREMLLGQITEQFYIEPTGVVNSFAVRFYPYGFANFIDLPLSALCDKETPLNILFGDEKAEHLSKKIIEANSTEARIQIIEKFLFEMFNDKTTIDNIVKSTIDTMLLSKGSKPLNVILKDEKSKRRQLERNFNKQIGLSPKQLSKVIRLQATLQMLLNDTTRTLTDIAYESEYYDQAHFIKDFKEFTGLTPKEFLTDEKMTLSSVLYKGN